MKRAILAAILGLVPSAADAGWVITITIPPQRYYHSHVTYHYPQQHYSHSYVGRIEPYASTDTHGGWRVATPSGEYYRLDSSRITSRQYDGLSRFESVTVYGNAYGGTISPRGVCIGDCR